MYIAVLLGVATFAYALDLVTKLIVVAKLEYHAPIDVLGDWLQFRATRNAGAAFGMGQGLTVVLTVIATGVVVVILRLARKLNSMPWAIALGLLLGGAFGNLTDRIFRSPSVFQGHVVDFIAPKHFAIFNLADSAIVIGGCLIVLLSFMGLQPDGSRDGDDTEDEGEGEDEGEESALEEGAASTVEEPHEKSVGAAESTPGDDSVTSVESGESGESTVAVEEPAAAKPGASAAPAPAETVSANAGKTPAKGAEQAGADHAVESGPDAGHTRIS